METVKKKKLLNASQASEYLGLSEGTVRQWASMKKISSVKLGKALRFDIKDLDDLIESSKKSANPN